jgi:hypothetical protein
MREEQVQAARDALEAMGELVTYTDNPEVSEQIWVFIQYDVDMVDGEGTPMGRVTVLRGMKEDLAGLTDQALFTLENGKVYQKKQTIKDDNITIAFTIGKKSSA